LQGTLPEAAAREFVESYGAIARSILEQRAEIYLGKTAAMLVQERSLTLLRLPDVF
jgi:hypothetical protein